MKGSPMEREPVVFYVTQEEIEKAKFDNPCRYNVEIACLDRDEYNCAKCGWNPIVSRRRIRKIRKELGL